MVDALVTLNAARQALQGPLFGWLRKRYDNTERFIEARDEMFAEWVAELAAAAKATEHRFAAVSDLQERVRFLEEKEPQRVLANYEFEAAREAIDERKRMLAYAATGGGPTNLTAAQLARVERVIRELDPEDVVGLKALTAKRSWGIFEAPQEANVEVLSPAGVVFITTSNGDDDPSIEITRTGRRVLDVLETYLDVLATEAKVAAANAPPPPPPQPGDDDPLVLDD